MQIVFAHQNHPAQFGEFAMYLARNGWDVIFATAAKEARPLPGCRLLRMSPHREPADGVHRYAHGMERAMINGQAFANAAMSARARGIMPDVVVAHSSWGSGTFAKAIWPETRLVAYAEWYYTWPHIDATDAETQSAPEDGRAHAIARNATMLLDLAQADLVFCPTRFQADRFPARLRGNMEVMPDGIDMTRHAPAEAPRLPEAAAGVPAGAEILTYATRGMEPHRGFPEFCRALARLQKKRPNLYAVIGGEDRVAYGRKLPEGDSWKKRMLAELDLDQSRIVWTGNLPRADYIRLLQSSHCHAYLTVPFVLSWSFLEAMSIACPLVASDTLPVREAATDGVEALLVDHRNIDALVAAIERHLDDRRAARAMGQAARTRIRRDYDAAWIFPWRARRLSDLVSAPSA